MTDAEKVAQEAQDRVYENINLKQSFVLEAGAGAGKTYALIETLKYLITNYESEYKRNGKKIACITYTNRAKDNIANKIKFNPIVSVDTIHGFFWSAIQSFQKELKECIIRSEHWQKRWQNKYFILNDALYPTEWNIDNIKDYKVQYSILANRIINPKDKILSIHHDDVIHFASQFIKNKKFQIILKSIYPFILIDEYQDTNAELVSVLLLEMEKNASLPMIGFYGDSWQKIYEDGIGEIQHKLITKIPKQSNFRSNQTIINTLNKIRPDLKQFGDKDELGSIHVFHTNSFAGERRGGKGQAHWTGDLLEQEASNVLEQVKNKLDWNFEDTKNTKILLLTNNILSKYGSYGELLSCFKYSDDLLRKNNKFINFFSTILEPICIAYKNKKYGEMFSVQGDNFRPPIRNNKDKEKLNNYLSLLLESREKTIFDVIETLINQPIAFLKLPDELEQIHLQIKSFLQSNEEEQTELSNSQETYKKISAVPYQQVINVLNYIDNLTPFSTQHGVKGEEYQNVLIVLGRGWNNYNWDNFLSWSRSEPPTDKVDYFERNRNLFYVSCSRAKTNLALLFTQKLSNESLQQLVHYFDENNIIDFFIVKSPL